ncbi:hypothetical protein LQ938_02875 [Microbacterium sp. cx-55]|uniref:hypothetical protein n=1 Tax=Microbacterium sp. cx-55 TaxID=2875948 RepID=UPI001CBB405A|nr:hypothetical protein [Microbacterium sp. cx-55]MBZ4486832.1 hypothetical protein [Microbacterium sp. cx-55]UGB35761.1 hypothetical protein LQ938_02875 [Microbacterium sp. cx-55]
MLLLIAQGWISFRVTPEPYPIVRMPSFGLAASPDGTYPATFVRAEASFSDGTSSEIDPYEIMAPFRFSTARPSYDYVFGPERKTEIPSDVIDWLRGRVEELSGGKTPTELRMCWTEADVRLKDAKLENVTPCELTLVEL